MRSVLLLRVPFVRDKTEIDTTTETCSLISLRLRNCSQTKTIQSKLKQLQQK